MRYYREKEEIVHIFRTMYERQTITMFEGNISVRMKDCFLMTPSQMNKEKITPEMIVETDENGRVLNETDMVPSSEYKMHMELYRLRPDVNCVVHSHSCFATAFAINGRPVSGESAELYMFFGGSIPVCSYAAPGTDGVFADFRKYFVDEDREAVLLANHGLVTAGKDPEQAYSRAESIEKLAKTLWIAGQMGEPSKLSDEDKKVLLERYRRRNA